MQPIRPPGIHVIHTPWVEKLLQLAACVTEIHRFSRRLLDARSAAISAAARASLAASLPASAHYSLAGATGGTTTSVSESGRNASHRVLAGAAGGASGLQCALATCVEEEALLPYTHEVDRLFSSPLPVRTIWAKLFVYEQLLTGLVRVTCAIEQGNLTGAHLLRFLEQESSFGPCLLSIALDTCIRHCQRVWVGQLAHWMAFGTLPPDGGAEFFISRAAPAPRPGAVAESRAERREERGSDTCIVSWDEYSINEDQLPPDFAPETAEAALFVGRAMLLLQEVGRRSESELSGRGAGSSRQRKHKGDVKRILDSVLALRKGRTKHAWDEQRVHEVVEAARKRAAHRLWQLVVRQSDLFGHLHAVHYFLLGGGGAFMQSVWQSLREVLAQPDVRARVANDKLQLAVEKASACIGEEATLKYFRTFSFKFIPPDLARPQPSAQSSTQASAQPSAPPATPVATAPAVEVAAAALSRLGVAADIASGTPGAAVGGGAGAGAAALARGSGGGTGLVVTPFDPSASRLRGVETGERRVPGVVQAGLPTPQQGLGRAQGGAQGQGQGQGQWQAQGQGQGQGRVEGQAQQEGRGRSQSTQSGGSSSGSSGSVNWWDRLEMNTGVAWPLQLVLSPTTLQRYNSVAAFLFRLRRVVLELQLAWLLLCKVRPEGARMRGLPQKGARGVVAGRGEGVRGGEGGLRGAGVGGVQGKGRGEAVGSGSGEEGQMKRTWSLPAGSGEAVRSGGVEAGPATAAATAAAGAAGAAGFTRSTSVAAGSVGGAGSGRGSSSGVVRISLGERKEHLMLCMMLKEMLQIVTSLQTYLHMLLPCELRTMSPILPPFLPPLPPIILLLPHSLPLNLPPLPLSLPPILHPLPLSLPPILPPLPLSLRQELDAKACALYLSVGMLHHSVSTPQVHKLLTHINFNAYYSLSTT
ncbi:unnamed protein product [Closterium sp. NIES-54]